jgi:chitin deacetylase
MIAKEVFGLTTVVWNKDSGDWAIGHDSAYTVEGVEATMRGWFSGPKSPGLVMLEHEASAADVQVFKAVYGDMLRNGWKVVNVAEAFGQWEYANAANDNATLIQGESLVQTLAPADLNAYAAAESAMQAGLQGGQTQSTSSSMTAPTSASQSTSTTATSSTSSSSSRESGSSGSGTSPAVAAATGSTSGASITASSWSVGALFAVVLAGSAIL